MEKNLSSVFRFREEAVSGVIYHFDLLMVTNCGNNSALVGDCLINISNRHTSMRMDQTVPPYSETRRTNVLEGLFKTAMKIEKSIYS